jgi:hypothetical protein
MNGRTIRIYQADGVPSGVLTAENINWTGRLLVAPRSQLGQLADRPGARQTGVYLLVGADPETPGRDLVYVGEGDNVLARLLKHNKDEEKDFWTRTVLVSSKDENLTKSHVRYLESRLIALTKQANRARLTNETEPETAALPESDKADMEFFLGVLGFTFTQQLLTAQGPAGGASPVFVMNPVGTFATAREVDGQFVVLKGSTARQQGVESWTSYRVLRDQLAAEGKLVAGRDGLLVFTEDVPFSSPSAAAAVVYGGNQNGRVAWRRTDTGQTYQPWQEEKLANATGAAGAAKPEVGQGGG